MYRLFPLPRMCSGLCNILNSSTIKFLAIVLSRDLWARCSLLPSQWCWQLPLLIFRTAIIVQHENMYVCGQCRHTEGLIHVFCHSSDPQVCYLASTCCTQIELTQSLEWNIVYTVFWKIRKSLPCSVFDPSQGFLVCYAPQNIFSKCSRSRNQG